MIGRNGSRIWLISAGVFGATGVAMGAFGAHLLRSVLPLQAMAIFETAVRYQLIHALALAACGALIAIFPASARRLSWAGTFYVAGIVLFSGSLYGLSMSDLRVLGLLTPLGGLCWIAAWALLAAAFWRPRNGGGG